MLWGFDGFPSLPNTYSSLHQKSILLSNSRKRKFFSFSNSNKTLVFETVINQTMSAMRSHALLCWKKTYLIKTKRMVNQKKVCLVITNSNKSGLNVLTEKKSELVLIDWVLMLEKLWANELFCHFYLAFSIVFEIQCKEC